MNYSILNKNIGESMPYTLSIPNNLIYEKDNQIIISIISYIKDFVDKIQSKYILIKNRKDLAKTMDIVYNNMTDFLNYIEDLSQTCKCEEDFEKVGNNLIKYDDTFYNYLQEIYTTCYDANEIIKKIDIKQRTENEQLTSILLTTFILIFKFLIDSVNTVKFKDIIENAE